MHLCASLHLVSSQFRSLTHNEAQFWNSNLNSINTICPTNEWFELAGELKNITAAMSDCVIIAVAELVVLVSLLRSGTVFNWRRVRFRANFLQRRADRLVTF